MIFKDISIPAVGRILVGGLPDDMAALALADLASTSRRTVIHVARDDRRMAMLADALPLVDPDLAVIQFPAWDCLPYDRVSPNPEVASRRLDALVRLLEAREAENRPRCIVLTTVNAILQRVPPAGDLRDARFAIAAGAALDRDALTAFLARNGYQRTSTVREPGECALRGGIIDIFPAGRADPVRIDLFGDEVEKIRRFDPVSQISTDGLASVVLEPVSEVQLDSRSIERFRAGYREHFGPSGDDPLYVAVSEGQRSPGMEHWMPLFHERLETLFDFVHDPVLSFDHEAGHAVAARHETIADFYDARKTFSGTASRAGTEAGVYRPLPPERLYVMVEEWANRLNRVATLWFSPFEGPEEAKNGQFDAILSANGRRCIDFVAQRARNAASKDVPGPGPGVLDAVRDHIAAQQAAGRRVVIAAYSVGSRERLSRLLQDHGVNKPLIADDWPHILYDSSDSVILIVFPCEHGFTWNGFVVLGEQDILGERLTRRTRRRRADAFLTDASDLAEGDFVVHVDHGIGRYDGLETITVSGAPHDCLRIGYEGGDRLFVPVENIETLSRYGSTESGVALDRLGGAAWQARKARLRKRLREMADELIRVAAARLIRPARRIAATDGLFDESMIR